MIDTNNLSMLSAFSTSEEVYNYCGTVESEAIKALGETCTDLTMFFFVGGIFIGAMIVILALMFSKKIKYHDVIRNKKLDDFVDDEDEEAEQ